MFAAKTSAVHEYCQVIGEKAKRQATPGSGLAAPPSKRQRRASSTQAPTTAAAAAPTAAVNKFAHAAGVGAKKTRGSRSTGCITIVKSGYPGGCAVPSPQASANSSPLSPPATDGAAVNA